ncbi:alpha/beta fold hydrolase [Paraburkholderia humisilvae]|uniref:3-oxoadipate enol-lactonase 2 n=1 Tax=Paraburkholderia humisilvae TaxID=627669 RepID=A0A6J5D6U2_9BURK|nr:alpha/beta fold hydrolase [Paraburkholderia humisilvae]CAB3749074.1 3-oxoadipate enol-lactonase 2 [Paraburkholderia humisilvae]
MDNFSYLTTTDGTHIAYRLDGDDDKPAIVLSNSIGTTLRMWDSQMPALSQHFRVLRYDARGHGASSVPAGPYPLARLAQDVLELMHALDMERAHFLGLSLGGIVGQWLGVHASTRIDRLVLSNTAPWLGPADRWDAPIAAVLQADDMTATAETFLRNWFPVHMLEASDPLVEKFRVMLLTTHRHGLAGAWGAVQETDMRQDIARITRPTLVIAGEHDTVTTASYSVQMANAIPGARLRVLPAVHLTNIEFPGEFNDEVVRFLRTSIA